MPSILDALPGVTLPISEISDTLSNMWRMDTTPNVDAPSEFRASQMKKKIEGFHGGGFGCDA